jgi:2-methylfumaryl-CoA isomerase
VFVTNLRVRGWMDYESLKKRREDLIMVSVIGNREPGPAVDYTVNPAVGFPQATGPGGLRRAGVARAARLGLHHRPDGGAGRAGAERHRSRPARAS